MFGQTLENSFVESVLFFLRLCRFKGSDLHRQGHKAFAFAP